MNKKIGGRDPADFLYNLLWLCKMFKGEHYPFRETKSVDVLDKYWQ